MRFMDGYWTRTRGAAIHSVKKMWDYYQDEEGIHFYVPCVLIQDLNDTCYGPVLEVRISSPKKDILAVTAKHYDGGEEKGPGFELFREETKLEVQEEEESLRIISGKLSAVVRKDDYFQIVFYYEGKKITSSDKETLAYITDLDYEADKWCDLNHCPPRPYYMKETYMREQLSLGIGELVYGLGEQFTPLTKNGQRVEMWNRDGGSAADQSYKSIPFYLSNKGYGVLVNHPEYINFEIGTENVEKVQFSVEGEKLEYLVIGGGTPKQVLSNYTALTGRSPVSPAWSFGLWLSTSFTPSYDEKTVIYFVEEMERRKIPLSVFHYDAAWMKPFELCNFLWDEKFGDAKAMLEHIKSRGVRICVWMNPYISQRSRLYREGKQGGFLLKKKDGSIWQCDLWEPGQTIVDFTNPAARKWFQTRLGELLDMGVDCLKTDFAERIPVDVEWYDGSDSKKMHNYYAYLYQKTVFDIVKEKKGDENAIVFGRAATVGTQQFPVNWAGDNLATYDSMAESLRGGLSFCQSGFGFWAHDISGFESTATPDLYKRWTAFGMLSTHSRLHGHDTYRVPWNFGEEACDVLRYFTRLKCSLMPYLFSKAVEVNKEGVPMMRAMMLEFPEDPACGYLDRQYMLGNALLVAPVFSESGEVTWYVPKGEWYHLLTDEKIIGERWITRTFDYFGLPLLVRPGTAVATGRSDGAEYDYCHDVTWNLYDIPDGTVIHEKIYRKDLSLGMTLHIERSADTLSIEIWGDERCRLRFHGSRVQSEELEIVQESENYADVMLPAARGKWNIQMI